MAFLDQGRWRVKVWVNGRKIDKCFPKGTPKSIAEEYQRKLKLGRIDPDYCDKKRLEVNFSIFADRWLKESCEVEHSYSYAKKCRQVIEQHLKPKLGQLRIGEVGNQDILAIQRELRSKGYAVQTINNILATASSVFKWALSHDLILNNPCAGIRRIKRGQKPELEVWTLEERDRFLSLLREKNQAFYQVCVVALFTGLRPSELRGLLRDALDFERSQIRVFRQWCTKQNKLVDYTKTRIARTVPVPKVVMEILSGKRALASDVQIFPFLTNSFGHRALKPYMTEAGVRVIRMHDFRHTFASHMLHRGSSLAEVKELLGHRKLESTAIYLHYMPDRNQGATERLVGEMKWLHEGANVISIARHGS